MKDEIIVSCIKGYATRQQRQYNMAGAQCMGRQQGRYSTVPAVRHPLDLRLLGLSKNYEDSIRHRHQMEVAAQQREQEGQRLMRKSDSIRKKLK